MQGRRVANTDPQKPAEVRVDGEEISLFSTFDCCIIQGQQASV